MKTTQYKHGGKRRGSGRKKKEATKVIRVAVWKIPHIEKMTCIDKVCGHTCGCTSSDQCGFLKPSL